MTQERLPGRWRPWCRICKSYLCRDPVYGPVKTMRRLRSGWRDELRQQLWKKEIDLD